MSREEAVCLASRALAFIFVTSALVELSHVPEFVQTFLYYAKYAVTSSTNTQYVEYCRHHSLVELGFLVVRTVGFALVSVWLFKGDPEVGALLLPVTSRENLPKN